ncbi:PD-(D/E)XK nuclease family protein [Acidiphilium sp. PA]|uniref:DUF6508 domain-containing protein n=1 Tax=Acidiphilium sp. PA TaxID=2871705 RepID=UPI002242E5D4|nr:DUF6508 domain-containing protein [Acidiphilium sp. PA]MCW8306337.1 PD-(D/E)XK nuclease family protein [Acidiphilium sp. PA]
MDFIFDQTNVDFGRYFSALAERDIDFLLLEELLVSEDFVKWFCEMIDLPDVKPAGAWHSVFDENGETDLLVCVYQGADKVGILIENKVAAAEQPTQAERYHIRGTKLVNQGKISRYQTVICAPAAYLGNIKVGAYDRSISYEQIAEWFDAQRSRRYAWRAHVLRGAVGQSANGYKMIVDRTITEFQAEYWRYLQTFHPQLLMAKPGDRGPNSTWIILKGHGFPKGVHLNHKISKNIMELAFSRTDITKLINFRSAWPEDIFIRQKGNEAVMALLTPQIDIRAKFAEQIPAVEAAFKIAERLSKYATIFLTKPQSVSTGTETNNRITDESLDKIKAIAKFLPIFTRADFKFGEWVRKDGEIGYVCLSDPAQEFIQMLYDKEWISQFSWTDWETTTEAVRLRDEPDFLAEANTDQIAKLLTVIVRKDRFVEGELLAAYESGLLNRIISRAISIRELHEGSA